MWKLHLRQAFCLNIFEKTQGEKNSSFQKNSRILYQKLNLPEVFYPKFRQKSQNCFCFEPKTTQKLNFLGKCSEKPFYHTKIQDNFHENNGRFAKTYATHRILEKTQEILEKTQGTGGLRLAHPPKKCPNKKPALRPTLPYIKLSGLDTVGY